MATHAPITGAPTRAPIILPRHRRIAIESEIEMHLHRASLLIARLDRADAPVEDMEDDDPAGGNIEDDREGPELYTLLPRYDLDQSRGPVNEREAARQRYREMMTG